MTNKDIEDMKKRIDELVKIAKDKENENAVLKQHVKTQREKIDSLLKELEEEKGKTIVISDGMITMRADMWEALNENKTLKDENTAIKQRIKDLEDACDTRYFLDGKDLIEGFRKHMGDDMCTSNNPFDDSEIDYDALIAELQDKHQQDCIRINDLTTTVNVLAGLYLTLRKNVGMD